jgi:threonine aldolase
MFRFECDYSEGAHPQVLKKLIDTNLEQTAGYGEDPYCIEAARLIKDRCGRQDVDIHFFVGGTQTNLSVISAALRPHQGAVTAGTGHINTHESGAVEATGHKVLALPGTDGKITAAQLQAVSDDHFNDANHEHMVQPKLVYISNPTEIGSIYSRAELTAISETCRKNDLFLYVDGARLGYALTAEGNDLDLPALAGLCDACYIGATKIGALFGEALVICNESLKTDFRYIIKQKGGLLAKGRLIGLQFAALFEDDLYFELARHANKMAMLIKEACIKKGYGFLTPSTTNQQFPIMPNEVLEKLKVNFAYSVWQKVDENHSAVRFCTSWATDLAAVQQLVAEIENA